MNVLNQISRREFALAVGSLCSIPSLAQTPPIVRFSAHSADGKRMLAIFSDAVKAMMDPALFKEGDPRSWMFQWYIHAVRRDRSKAAELKRVYAAATPEQQLAARVWETCEAHRPTSRGQDYFLPWHRMYLRFLEDIVRTVTGKNEFSLPYWDYTDPKHRALPEEFLRKGDSKWGALFRPDRNSFANEGKSIDASGLPIDLQAMSARYYGDSETEAGFGSNLDGLLHGNVHVSVGNERGMGRVPWAANDPIFWLHHCNIDRIWAAWSREGGGPPPKSTFMEEFDFADGQGKAVKARVQDYAEHSVVAYDEYPRRPAGSPGFPAGPVLTSTGLRFQSRKRVLLGTAASAVPLFRVSGSGPLLTSSAGMGDVSPEMPVHVVLDGISGSESAESSIFEVHVASGTRVPSVGNTESYVGSLCLFGVGGHGAHAGHGAQHRRKVSYLVVGAARTALVAQGSSPQLLLLPRGKAAGRASVEKVSVVGG